MTNLNRASGSSNEALKIINHFDVQPNVQLTNEISATELVPPSDTGDLSAHKIWIPPNAAYPPHTHPSPHIIIVEEGGGWVRLNEKEAPLKSGDVFHVPAQAVHQVGADARGMIMIALSAGSKRLTDPDRLRVCDEVA